MIPKAFDITNKKHIAVHNKTLQAKWNTTHHNINRMYTLYTCQQIINLQVWHYFNVL